MRVLRRKSAPGFQVIHFMGLMIIALMASALAIDFGYYYAAQNQMQTAADSAALAATQQLYRSIDPSPAQRMSEAQTAASTFVDRNFKGLVIDNSDVIFGFVDPTTKKYDSATFRTPSNNPDYSLTGGFNAVRVRVRKTSSSPNGPLTTIMANMFGVRSMDTSAYSVALIDQNINAITNGGLRPIYVCEGQLQMAMQNGIPGDNVIRLYGDRVSVDGNTNIANCPAPGSGNWGFADLRDNQPGAPGNATLSDWWANGYNGTVQTDHTYSTQPGNSISSNGVTNAIDNLIANHTVINVPLYDSFTGTGSNTQVHVSGFVGFVITDYDSKAPASDRYVQGYFTQAVCGAGACTSGGTGTEPGGAIVKIRLASTS